MRNKIMRELVFFLVSAMLMFTLCSCGRERPEDVGALVLQMAECGGEIAGRLYLSDKTADDPAAHEAEAMPSSLAAAAFGEGREPGEFADLEAYAVWLCSFAEPVEYGCFVVARERDTDAITQLCLRRIDAIRRLCGENIAAEPPLVIGRCVFYAVGDGAAAALDEARTAMGH